MHFSYAGVTHEPSDVVGVDPAAGKDLDRAVRLNDEPANLRGALGSRGRTTRGQHAIDAKMDQALQRYREIGTDVECPMERHRPGQRGVDQLRRPVLGDLVCSGESSGHNAVGARVFRAMNLLEHRLMLGLCVHEIPGARTDQHEDWNEDLAVTFADQLDGGRRAAMGQIGA